MLLLAFLVVEEKQTAVMLLLVPTPLLAFSAGSEVELAVQELQELILSLDSQELCPSKVSHLRHNSLS
jgi:hypothetical protein